jgi:hypothetical protein
VEPLVVGSQTDISSARLAGGGRSIGSSPGEADPAAAATCVHAIAPAGSCSLGVRTGVAFAPLLAAGAPPLPHGRRVAELAIRIPW